MEKKQEMCLARVKKSFFVFCVFFIALSISSCYLIRDIAKADENACKVHNKPMHKKSFWIEYGLILGCDHCLLYDKAQSKYFPNSERQYVLGGCIVQKERWLKKWVCSDCTAEDIKWRKRINNICLNLGIKEHVLCNTCFNYGLQSLESNKLVEGAFGFAYCINAFPNFYLNDKAHYWLMTIFIRLGAPSIAKPHFVSAVRLRTSGITGETSTQHLDSILEPIILRETDSSFDNIVKKFNLKESSDEDSLNQFRTDLMTLIKSLLDPALPVNEILLNKYKYLNSKAIPFPELEKDSLSFNNTVEKTFENIRVSCESKIK